MYDAEPRILPLKRGKSTSVETWWSIQVKILNHSTSYRFLFLDKVSFRWLNGAGVFNYDVVDREDFELSPDRNIQNGLSKVFLPDFPPIASQHLVRNANYQIGQFHASGINYRMVVVTLLGKNSTAEIFKSYCTSRSLTSLGVNAIYFTPFFPSRSNHRYDASSFDFVDPLLGGDKGLIEFSKAAQQRGLKVMGDLTTNHCGAGHPWLQKSFEEVTRP